MRDKNKIKTIINIPEEDRMQGKTNKDLFWKSYYSNWICFYKSIFDYFFTILIIYFNISI